MTVRIPVRTARPYDVVVGRNPSGELAGMLGGDARRVAIVHPGSVAAVAEAVRAEVAGLGYEVYPIEVPDAEAAKTAETAARCWAALGTAGFTRSDAVIGVGGGATTDLAGFVAATWLRGVRLVQVPTTVLGMVDAAVGGKTGINTAEGKNLVGAFHEPAGVLCDLATLDSLPVEEFVPGLAEVVKCGFIADPVILELVEKDPAAAATPGADVTAELIERSIRVKAEVVARDLTETGAGGGVGREVLNYGHTLGHAVERVEGYRWRHGTAVSVGLVFVAELARLAGLLDEPTAARHREILATLGLPTTYRGGRWPELLAAMRVDKKTRGNVLRFVVLHGLAQPAILADPAPDLLTGAYDLLSA